MYQQMMRSEIPQGINWVIQVELKFTKDTDWLIMKRKIK